MTQKGRLSATVDPEVLRAAEEQVSAGRARNLSAWVNDAMRAKLEEDRRLEALAAFVVEQEAEHGPITERDRDEAWRWARERAIVVRGSKGAARARSSEVPGQNQRTKAPAQRSPASRGKASK
jgi:Arc/MetJ-type ribon-helix-helix transcriptional regulator